METEILQFNKGTLLINSVYQNLICQEDNTVNILAARHVSAIYRNKKKN
jgi:hypothetical protein